MPEAGDRLAGVTGAALRPDAPEAGPPARWDGLAVRMEGRCAYRPTWALQEVLAGLRREQRLPDTLLLLEHEPVITLGRHADTAHLLAPGAIPVVHTNRGGDVTYHGPGQLTAYLICDLRAHDLGVRAYVEVLEETLIRTLGHYGITGERRAGLTGVWVARPEWAKVAAIGVRVARGVSLHGIALNVRGPLTGFRRIVPCGLAGETVTAIDALGSVRNRPPASAAPTLAEVGTVLCAALGERLGIRFRPLNVPAIGSAEDADQLVGRLKTAARRGARKPGWLRTRLPGGEDFARVRRALRAGRLHTVCESARCPNQHECWNAGTATFMILGEVCTRGCRFCAVATGTPAPPSGGEPEKVARAVVELGLRHVVVTSVTRDDLPDGGAEAFVATVRAIRAARPGVTVEVLVPDFAGDRGALGQVLAERPEVFNHNVETVPRLYPQVRPGADYRRSLAVLRQAAEAGLRVKSGFMVGLGESPRELGSLLHDLRAAGCASVTIGQYLQPTAASLSVKRYPSPEEFTQLEARARSLGFAHVAAGPLVRSSYHAAEGLGARPAAGAPC